MQNLTVQITAVDRFSKTLLRMRNSASQAQRPLVNTQRQVAQAGRLMGLPALGRGLGRVAQSAQTLATNLGLATGSMSALTSGSVLSGARAGPAGAVLALTAAVTALTVRWAGMTYSMNRTASTFGLQVKGFQRVRGAAEFLKIPVNEADQAMTNFAQTMRLVNIGDPSGNVARGVLDKYGIPVTRGPDGVVDSLAILRNLSRAIQRTGDPLTQLAAADVFGVSGLLPLLKRGPERMDALGREYEASGASKSQAQIDSAVKLTEALQRLYVAVDGLANRVAGWSNGPVAKAVDSAAGLARGDAKAPPFVRDAAALEKSRQYVWSGGRLFGGGSNTADTRGRRVSGRVTDEQGRAAPSLAGLLNPGTREKQVQMMEDWKDRGTMYSSDAVRQRVEATVQVLVSAPPGATVRATSDNPAVPVRVSRPMPTGNMP